LTLSQSRDRTPIWGVYALGAGTLEIHPIGASKDGRATTDDVIGETDLPFPPVEQLGQQELPLDERRPGERSAAPRQIEDLKEQAPLVAGADAAHGGQRRELGDDPGQLCGEVDALTRDEANVGAALPRHQAPAVVLDLMQSGVAFEGGIGAGADLWGEGGGKVGLRRHGRKLVSGPAKKHPPHWP
jgi:hypothetical protein